MILAIWWEPQAVGPGARTRIELMVGQSHVLYQVTPRGIRETRHAKFPAHAGHLSAFVYQPLAASPRGPP